MPRFRFELQPVLDARKRAEDARQLEVARLKREQRKVREEEKFSAAALFVGVARQQEKEYELPLYSSLAT